MELRQLRHFVTVAETLNVHRAAERLNMAQPPLSVSIRKLETDLGSALFERTPRGMVLTPVGRLLLPVAQQILAQTEEMRTLAAQGRDGERGRLRIGFVGSATHAVIPRLLPAYQARYPGVDLTLQESSTNDILDEIDRRVLDVGIVRLPLLRAPSGVEVTVIEQDELMAVLPAADALTGETSLDLGRLAGRDFIAYPRDSNLHQLVAMACQEEGFLPRIRQEARSVQTLLCLIESGMGVGLAPARWSATAGPGLRFVPLSKPPRVQLGLVTPQQRPQPAALRLRDLAADLLA